MEENERHEAAEAAIQDIFLEGLGFVIALRAGTYGEVSRETAIAIAGAVGGLIDNARARLEAGAYSEPTPGMTCGTMPKTLEHTDEGW